jgi:hypothetical protein
MLYLLFIFTIVYEILIVISTVSTAERRKILSPIFSAILEPIKVISLLFVIDAINKYLAIAIIMIACVIGNYLGIIILDYIDKKRGRLK